MMLTLIKYTDFSICRGELIFAGRKMLSGGDDLNFQALVLIQIVLTWNNWNIVSPEKLWMWRRLDPRFGKSLHKIFREDIL